MVETATAGRRTAIVPRNPARHGCRIGVRRDDDGKVDRRAAHGDHAGTACRRPSRGRALVFGQFLREQPYSLWLAVAGVAIWLWFIGMAVAVAGGKQ